MERSGVYTLIIKPFLDRLFAVALLIMFLPLLMIIAVINYWQFGSFLFIQTRPGLRGNLFDIYKFQSLKKCLYEGQDDLERITKWGSFLRKTSLDEIPQLINILKGEMSFVGPRPFLKEYMSLYNSYHQKRHNVKPGITGLAQVKGRNGLDWNKRLDLDMEYVEKQSFKLDLKIMFLTFFQVVKFSEVNSKAQIGSVRFYGYETRKAG